MSKRKRAYDRLMLAVIALRRDEDCIEANLVLADHREHDDDKILRLYIAQEEGERLWGSAFARCVVGTDLADVPAAQPWLEVMLRLGACLERIDEPEEAREWYERLLELDSLDRFGARAHLDAMNEASAPAPRM